MKASLLRLAKLRATQHRQAQMWAGRLAADLAATEQCAVNLMDQHRQSGVTRAAMLWQHDEQLLSQLQIAAQKLTGDLLRAQDEVRERAREAKQMEKLVEKQRQQAADKRQRAEVQQVEAWGRNQRSGLPPAAGEP